MQEKNDLPTLTDIEKFAILDSLLAKSSTVFGRLAYLAELHDLQAGSYPTSVLPNRVNERAASSLLSEWHTEAFMTWLDLSLSEQFYDFRGYLIESGRYDDATLEEEWADNEQCARLFPKTARQHERDLFLTDFRLVVGFALQNCSGGSVSITRREPARSCGTLGRIAAALHIGVHRHAA